MRPIPVIQKTIRVIATATGRQAQEMAQIIGVDLVSGLPLIGDGK